MGRCDLRALQSIDPHEMEYVIRLPLYGGHFHGRHYLPWQTVFSGIEVTLRETLGKKRHT